MKYIKIFILEGVLINENEEMGGSLSSELLLLPLAYRLRKVTSKTSDYIFEELSLYI